MVLLTVLLVADLITDVSRVLRGPILASAIEIDSLYAGEPERAPLSAGVLRSQELTLAVASDQSNLNRHPDSAAASKQDGSHIIGLLNVCPVYVFA